MKYSAIATFVVSIGISLAAHAAGSQSSYVPGMGEIMGANQMRHAKLWLASNSGNWALASYELAELKEGFSDAVTFHPMFKGTKVSLLLRKFTDKPMQDIGEAIGEKDGTKFRQSFDALTGACNACHQAAHHGYIVIKRPDASSFDNQEFAIKTK